VRLWKAFAVIGLFLSIVSGPESRAQEEYPNRNITLLHGFGAGGNADVFARIIAEGLSQRLGKPVIVEARPGAGGTLASDRVAKAAPDGYTLIVLTGGHSVSGALQKSLPYKPVDDFQMISTVGFFPFVIAVNANHKFRTLADLIAAAKQNPNSLTYSSVGVGTTQHLAGALLASMTGIEMVHVPYRGGGGPINDLLGGQIDILVDSLTITAPQLAAGTIRGLAVTSPSPWFSIPSVPTVASTVPGYDVRSWLGLAGPKNMPQPIVDRLNRELRLVLETPAVREKLEAMGNEVRGSSPDEMRKLVTSEIERWKAVISDAKISQQ